MAIARTLLHELAHAYLLSYIDNMAVDLGSVNPTDFNLIYYAVLNNTYTGAYVEQFQHEQMARKFVNPIRDALRELDNIQNLCSIMKTWPGVRSPEHHHLMSYIPPDRQQGLGFF